MTGYVFGLAEAATVCGCSTATIRRHKGELLAAGAIADPKGWRIPQSALVDAGLWRDNPGTGDAPAVTAPKSPPDDSPVTALRAELAEWRRRAEVAEAVAAERAAALDDLRRVVRAIEPPPAAREPTARLRRWLRRTD